MLSEAEKEQEVKILKSLLVSNNISGFSNLDLDRWIVAFVHSEKALTGIKKCLSWRKDIELDAILNPPIPEIIASQQLSGKCIILPNKVCDPMGRPIMICRPVRHDRSTELEDMLHYMTYCLETICRIADKKKSRDICTICDLEKFGMSNMDYPVVKHGIRLMSQYYPERLGKLYIVNSPYIFTACWFVVRRWLNQRTLKKIHFVSGSCSIDSVIETNTFPESFGWHREH